MPSAVSSHNNYYAAHHRRQSSQSQTNLPDQVRQTASQVHSPNRSLVFLPSTAYSPSQSLAQRSRTPSLSNPSRSNSMLDCTRNEEAPNDPHEFYRQYQDPFTKSSPVALHQEAIRTAPFDPVEEPPVTARKSSIAAEDRTARAGRNGAGTRKLTLNTQILPNATFAGTTSKPAPGMPTVLRSRKASFKDLVARFDAAPDDIPPLPIQQVSRPASRTASPMPYAPGDTSHFYQPPAKRAPSRISEPSRRTGSPTGSRSSSNARAYHSRGPSGAGGLSQVTSNPESPAAGRRLLFGEVPSSTHSVPAGPGYGIHSARRRRGSEGSPMHSPNPMFQTKRSNAQGAELPVSPLGTQSASSKLPHETDSRTRTAHRRANSDISGPASRILSRGGQHTSSPRQRYSTEALTKASAQSRLPVSTRHQHMASDSTVPSSTGPPAIIPHRQLPFRALESGKKAPSPSASGERKQQSPRRQPRSDVQIKSPNNRGRGAATTNGEKSPSLRANIIAPPPKVSPPLRSSRPRMAVSSASTAASRAKMAEKFETSAKQQIDRKAIRRQRPPELSDIDLKARRLKITQALSRSREGQDLKGGMTDPSGGTNSRSNSTTPSFEELDESNQRTQQAVEIPAVVVDEPVTDPSEEERAFYTPNGDSPQDQQALTQAALKLVEGKDSPVVDDVDSPTLGHAEATFGSIPFSLDTHLQPFRDEREPQSAMTEGTVATEATMIDVEPQTDTSRLQTTGQSLYSQISALRSQDSPSPVSSSLRTSGANSNHADQVSVHLMLRDTTYLDDDEAVEKGYHHLAPIPQHEPGPSRSNERSSWTSSIDEALPSDADDDVPSVHSLLHQQETGDIRGESILHFQSDHSSSEDDSSGEYHARDAYTIVNKVLQQQTPSGVVDQQLVDRIYHRIIQASPDLADVEHVDNERVQRLCLHELDKHHRRWEQLGSSPSRSKETYPTEEQPHEILETTETTGDMDLNRSDTQTLNHVTPLQPPSSYRGHHRYKSSLDSAEDWQILRPRLWTGCSSPLSHQNISRRHLARLEKRLQL